MSRGDNVVIDCPTYSGTLAIVSTRGDMYLIHTSAGADTGFWKEGVRVTVKY